MTGDEVQNILENAGVFWVYQGEPRPEVPHALLTSGKHSNGYVNVGEVLKAYPIIRKKFAEALLSTLPPLWEGVFNWVVGSDTSATDLAGDVAKLAGVGHIKMVKGKEAKKQIWHPDNKRIREGDIVLHVEELITVGGSSHLVREGIRIANDDMVEMVRFAPFLPVIVDRSSPGDRVVFVERSRVLPLLQLSIENYEPDLCPYCKAGSEAIKPKFGDNWSRLTGS